MNIIEQKIAELSREEEISQMLDERRVNDLNNMILDKFIEIQKSHATNKNKAREWNNFNHDFCQQNAKDLNAINLKIDADFLRSETGKAAIICQDGWNFDFKVSLFGQFDRAFFSEVNFKDHCWIGAVFKEVVKFHNVNFYECATFYESLFEDLVSFRKVTFKNNANFIRNEFDGEAYFEIESNFCATKKRIC